MINLYLAEMIIGFITFFIAYVISTTLAGAFRAWVAKMVGDETAEDAGLLTLNPIVHIDPVGLFMLVFFNLGWGRYAPINPFNIHAPQRLLKIIVAYFSDVVIYFFIALTSLILLLIFFDVHILKLIQYMVLSRDLSHLYIVQLYPDYGSLKISIAFILVALVYLNVILAVLNMLINFCSITMLLFTEKAAEYSQYQHYVVFFLPILLIFFFSGPLRIFWLNLIVSIGYFLAHLFRLV
jgi:hypothetical protein